MDEDECASPVTCDDPDSDTDPEGDDDGTTTDDTTDDDTTTGLGIGTAYLDEQAAKSSEEAAQSLAERISAVGEPTELDVGGLEAPMNAAAAALVAVGMSIAVIAIGVRNWRAGWRIPTRFLRYALVSLFAVSASLGLWELVVQLSAGLAVIPEEISLAGDIWSGPFAGVTLPAAEVLLDIQPYVVGALIASLPLAAAISMFGPYSRLVWIVAALVVANIIWLPFFVIFISRLLVSTDAAYAGWWALAACICAVGTNSLALAGVRAKED